MKKSLTIICILIGFSSYATKRYFAVTGSDSTGNGSIGNPYASLRKACSVAVAGDTVHGVAGTYVQSAVQVIVAVGVHIEGEGMATRVTLTYTLAGSNGFNNAAIQLVSTTPNTNGNQSISDIWFDGNNHQCYSGILVHARGGVTFNRCKFTNFGITAINLNGKTGQNTGTDPIAFADGNQILNCTFLDCNDRVLQQANSVSCGSISIAGQTNLLLQSDTGRNINNRQGHNGDIIGGVQGNSKSVRIVNFIFQKPEDEGAGFNFSIEIWYSEGNCEITGCTFIGGGCHIDYGYGDANKGAFAYSWNVHDNTFMNPTLMASAQNLPNVTGGGFVTGKAYIIKTIGTTNFIAAGAASNTPGVIFTATNPGSGTGTANASHPTESIAIQFETSTNTALKPINATIGDAIIQNNSIQNIGCLIQMTLNNNPADFISNLQIDHNYGTLGFSNATYSGAFNFTISTGLSMNNIHIENNTLLSAAGVGCLKGILILQPDAAGSSMSNIYFLNNIGDGCASGYGYLVFRGSQACNNIFSQNNITFGNAFTNNPYTFPGKPAPTNFTNSNNIKFDPLFVSATDLHLSSHSPGIGTGLNPPATYIGAFATSSPNQSPIADAGTNKNITLPVTSVTQVGSGTDPDGTITSYLWTLVSGPVTPTFGSATSATTTINGLTVAGYYVVQIQVTDNLGATAIDTASIVVNASAPVNLPPVVNAGGNKNITLPTSSLTQAGSATDPDGTIVGYAWTQGTNPTTATIVSPTSSTTVISGMTVQGIYSFTLTATDNSGATGSQTITVIVNPATPVAPVAHAGTDQSINWPANSVTLSGSGTDADGTIVAYSWAKSSGAGANITNPGSASTTVTGMAVGVYQFQLTVIDNSGLTATDIVQITVNKGTGSIIFSTASLKAHYTSLPLLPTAITSPVGLPYNITLDGVSGGKINVGSYAAVAGITDPNWNFTPASATFNIVPDSTVVINASNKTVFYDGNQQTITGTTTPAGVPLAYLYDGVDVPGGVTGPGTFDVTIFTASDNYWSGPIHRTLTINVNPAIIAISDTDQIYDASPKTVTVTSAYTYTLTGVPQTNAGVYPNVQAHINDGIHVGADTATLTIHPKPAVLSWSPPAPIPYGSMLTAGILSASADVAGTWAYDHAIGEKLPLGVTRITGTFTPSSGNYSGGTVSVNVNVYAVTLFNNFYIIGPDGVIYIEQ